MATATQVRKKPRTRATSRRQKKEERMRDALNAPMRVPIKELMSREVVCVPEDLSVEVLEELLLERELAGAPVVDREGRLVGFVSMTDIVRELHDRGDLLEDFYEDRPVIGWGFHEEQVPRTVAQVMSPVAFELQESCPLSKAVAVMATQALHRIPVVSSEGALVGVVTAADIVRYLARIDASLMPDRASEATREAGDSFTEADRMAALGFFAGGLAHEINNALTPTRLSLGRLTSFELSRRPLSAARLHRIELLQDVREGIARIERVVRKLRTFSHTEDGPRQTLDLTAVLDIATGLAANDIRHRAHLVREYAPIPHVCAKPAELCHVFLNLLVNAAHAIPEGEAHLNEIRISTRTDDRGHAVIEIHDTGKGIPADVIPRLCEPFFTTGADGQGLGLGLAVSRDVIVALDGDLAIESIEGSGTTVRVRIPPTDDVGVPAVANEPSRAQAEAVRAWSRRILIVDDDRPVAAAIAFELGEHDVVVAESGREALEILQRDKGFDVILCDLMMPEVSGIDVYEALRFIAPSLLGRVVLMTGGAFTPRAGQFLAEVKAPVIEKPFDAGQLLAIVERARVDTLERAERTLAREDSQTAEARPRALRAPLRE